MMTPATCPLPMLSLRHRISFLCCPDLPACLRSKLVEKMSHLGCHTLYFHNATKVTLCIRGRARHISATLPRREPLILRGSAMISHLSNFLEIDSTPWRQS